MALTDRDNIVSYDYSRDYGAANATNENVSNYSDYQYSSSGDYYDYSGDYPSDLGTVKHAFNYSGLAVTELASQPPRWDPTANFLDLVALKIYMFVPTIAAGVLLGLSIWILMLVLLRSYSFCRKKILNVVKRKPSDVEGGGAAGNMMELKKNGGEVGEDPRSKEQWVEDNVSFGLSCSGATVDVPRTNTDFILPPPSPHPSSSSSGIGESEKELSSERSSHQDGTSRGSKEENGGKKKKKEDKMGEGMGKNLSDKEFKDQSRQSERRKDTGTTSEPTDSCKLNTDLELENAGQSEKGGDEICNTLLGASVSERSQQDRDSRRAETSEHTR